MSQKEQLLKDIELLLNNYPEGLSATSIDPKILQFLDEESLKGIVRSLLEQKENVVESNREWMGQFKYEK